MTSPHDRQDRRLLDLLADRALQGLDDVEAEELDRLAGEAGAGFDVEALDRAAAAADLARCRPPFEPMPAALRARLDAQIATFTSPGGAGGGAVTRSNGSNDGGSAPKTASLPAAGAPGAGGARQGDVVPLPPRRGSVLPWILAAACLALAIAGWVLGPRPIVVRIPAPEVGSALPVAPPPPPSLREQRERLLREASDVVRLDWSATKDAAGRGASGDVVWSNAEQRGFMTFRGLAPNNRAEVQFQLWIFDRSQDERTPVDGGVFDVDAGSIDATSGDVVVPIQAKLRVARPYLFAVTMEKPGGVVVSKRKHIVLTAATTG